MGGFHASPPSVPSGSFTARLDLLAVVEGEDEVLLLLNWPFEVHGAEPVGLGCLEAQAMPLAVSAALHNGGIGPAEVEAGVPREVGALLEVEGEEVHRNRGDARCVDEEYGGQE